MKEKKDITKEDNYKETLLYKATLEWTRVARYCYVIKYGYKKRLYNILLTFSPEEFSHLAGFQYLRDLNLPRFNSAKLIKQILNGTVTQTMVEKGAEYAHSVEPRLLAMLSLEDLLNSEFTLFSFRPEFYSSFRTGIEADYLISSEVNGVSYVFLFCDNPKATEINCICRSIFVRGKNNYEENQRPFAILKKSRINISTHEEEILFVKSGFEEQAASESNQSAD